LHVVRKRATEIDVDTRRCRQPALGEYDARGERSRHRVAIGEETAGITAMNAIGQLLGNPSTAHALLRQRGGSGRRAHDAADDSGEAGDGGRFPIDRGQEQTRREHRH
jgi:hypothetical protein